MQSKSAAVAVAIFALLVGARIVQAHPPATADAPVPLHIAKDTTFIVKPLHSDGTPDYLAAYNARLRQVAPDKNAYTYILQATGPLPGLYQQKMLAALHLSPFPKGAASLKSLDEFERDQHPNNKAQAYDVDHDKGLQLHDLMNNALLPAADQPLVAQWLDTQDQPMKLLEKAAQQNVCAIPLCPLHDDDAIFEALPNISPLVRCVEPFCARANLRAARGDFAGAQRDLVTAFRLSRLVQQTPLLIVRFAGSADEMYACRTARIITLSAPMSADDLRSLAHALDHLPPAPALTDIYAFGERFFALDTYSQIARGNGARILRLDLMMFDNTAPIDQGDLNQVDWNSILRSVNHDFDRAAAISSTRDWRKFRVAQRSEAATRPAPVNVPTFPAFGIFTPGAIDGDFAATWAAQRKEVLAFLHKRPGETREHFTARIQQLFAGPKAADEHFTNLLISRALEFPLTQTTLALAIYHADHHVWPDALAQLVPQYLPAVPQDPYSEGPLVYRITPAGFLLYSVGPNGKDDGGQRDRKKSQDDIAVSFPLAPAGLSPPEPK